MISGLPKSGEPSWRPHNKNHSISAAAVAAAATAAAAACCCHRLLLPRSELILIDGAWT